MAKQTAIVIDESNRKNPDPKVQIVQKDIPKPGQGEVLVRITLRPVHPSDVASVALTYGGFKPEKFPATPGNEAVAKVEENGPGASKFAKGTRVVAVPWGTFSGEGTWQQYAVVPEASLIAVPDSVSDESAAQFLVNPATAYGFLEELKVPPGEYLLQSAAGSVLGRQLIALAKSRSVRTINLVRRKEQVQELLDIGADEVIATSEENPVDAVKRITDRRLAYAAVDPVAGEMTGTIAAAVRPHGTILVYGALGGTTVTVGVGDLLYRGVVVTGFWLGVWLKSLGAERGATLDKLMGLLAQGVISPHSGKKFLLEQAQEAIAESVREGRGGKVFLEG